MLSEKLGDHSVLHANPSGCGLPRCMESMKVLVKKTVEVGKLLHTHTYCTAVVSQRAAV